MRIHPFGSYSRFVLLLERSIDNEEEDCDSVEDCTEQEDRLKRSSLEEEMIEQTIQRHEERSLGD